VQTYVASTEWNIRFHVNRSLLKLGHTHTSLAPNTRWASITGLTVSCESDLIEPIEAGGFYWRIYNKHHLQEVLTPSDCQLTCCMAVCWKSGISGHMRGISMWICTDNLIMWVNKCLQSSVTTGHVTVATPPSSRCGHAPIQSLWPRPHPVASGSK